jgi:hypothetical protein
MNESLESKMIPRNFIPFTAGIGVPSSLRSGSKWCLRLLQKFTHTVFELENRNPLVSAQV